jgi:hypothetical protein
MSWCVCLEDEDEKTLTVSRHYGGATFPIGGSTKAETHVTYNYSRIYREVLDPRLGLAWLDSKRAGDTIEMLDNALSALDEQCARCPDTPNYWDDNPWNARKPLYLLRSWAEQYPGGIWRIR